MADTDSINEYFSVPGHIKLPEDVSTELMSIMRLHGLSAQELFFKWESYSIKMGSDNTALDRDTARAFKQDIQEALERETRGQGTRSTDRKGISGAPRATGEEMLDLLGVRHGQQTTSSTKRKAPYETPATVKVSRSADDALASHLRTAPYDTLQQSSAVFSQRTNAGQVVETLNDHLATFEPPLAPHAQSRVKLVANSEFKKFAYKPLAMHLTEASEILDERIDEFASILQEQYGFEDGTFGNAATISTSEIVAVGRIASDTPESKPNQDSLVLETSRKTGAGLRVPLKFSPGISVQLFPGQIVGFRGKNASGDYLLVSEVIDIPLLHPAASPVANIEAINERLGIEDSTEASATHALNIMISSGPYTADDNLDFEPLHALCERAQSTAADVLVLLGPFLDIEHPLIANGDFDLPDGSGVQPDQATLTDAFRIMISEPLNRLAQSISSIVIILVPSVRDAVQKHVSWPQQNLPRRELGLPKQAKVVSNPVMISLNETMVAISSPDILNDIRLQEVSIGKTKSGDLLSRLPRHVISQRHFFPMFPPIDREQLVKTGTDESLATGTPMDITYLKLAEWSQVQPDVLVLPSTLPPFAKVVEGVVVINPGALSKRRGPGTFAQWTMHPRQLSEAEKMKKNEPVGHKAYDRARLDIVRI